MMLDNMVKIVGMIARTIDIILKIVDMSQKTKAKHQKSNRTRQS
jgi:hypothetical protein